MGEQVAQTWADFVARWKKRLWHLLNWILEVMLRLQAVMDVTGLCFFIECDLKLGKWRDELPAYLCHRPFATL